MLYYKWDSFSTQNFCLTTMFTINWSSLCRIRQDRAEMHSVSPPAYAYIHSQWTLQEHLQF
jgi:hypothetical protein